MSAFETIRDGNEITLFEAIRRIKPGQAIEVLFGAGASIKITWERGQRSPWTKIEHGNRPLNWKPFWTLTYDAAIVDLPAPKLMLPEAAKVIAGDRYGCEWCVFEHRSNDCQSHPCAEGKILYVLQEAAKMNIDWEAK